MKQFKAVFFDMGYTLVRTDREIRMQECLLEIGVQQSIPTLERAYHWVDKYFMREFPGLLAKDPSEFHTHYMNTLLNHLGLSVSEQHLNELNFAQDKQPRGAWAPIPGAVEVLQALRKRGVVVGLISNWDLTARQVLRQCGLDALLDIVVISCEVQVEKPSPEIFAKALAHSAILPEDALYIGDNFYDDIIGARSIGMDAVLLNRFERLGIEEIEGCQVFSSVLDVYQAMKAQFLHPIHQQGTAG